MNSRDVKVKQILIYELALVPTSMFEKKTRDVHMAKSKSTLKNRLQVAQFSRATGPDAIVIDGCAILWVAQPSKGSVQDLVTKLSENYVTGKLKGGTRVHVIFDCYCDCSIKSGTRCSRKAQVS